MTGQRNHAGKRRDKVEGIHTSLGANKRPSARVAVAERLSFAVWVGGPDAATRLDRAVARDGEQNRTELRRWQEFEQRWFAVDRTEERAGLATSE
jgi:hypothetical protein